MSAAFATWTPKLTPADLDAILGLLPLPNRAVTSVVEGAQKIDYSFLHKRIREDNPSIGEAFLSRPKELYLEFGFPGKTFLSEIYKDQFRYLTRLDEGIRGTLKEDMSRDLKRVRLEVQYVLWEYSSPLPPRLEQEWEKLGSDTLGLSIHLTPERLSISHITGEKPVVIKVLIDKLSRSHLDIEIKPYNRD